MSNAYPPNQSQQNNNSGVVVQLRGVVQQLSAIVQALMGGITIGSFTLAAAATTTVAQPAIQADSVVVLTPTNAAAATLMASSKALYVKTLTPGASFTVATADGTSASGVQTFSYVVRTP